MPELNVSNRSGLNLRSVLLWSAVGLVGAIAWGVLALSRG
jgi:hypothetical protein